MWGSGVREAEAMFEVHGEKWGAGVDYVRCSIQSLVRESSDPEYRDWLRVIDMVKRCLERVYMAAFGSMVNWSHQRIMMYQGEGAAHVFYGLSKLQGLMWQISGNPARYAQGLGIPRDNCSRLDIQVTLWPQRDPDEMIMGMYRFYTVGAGVKYAKKRKVTLVQNARGGHTLYVGSRSSNYFYRVYNKSVQDDTCEPGALRLEVELKGDASSQTWEIIEPMKGPHAPLNYVAMLFLRVGIHIEGCGSEPVDIPVIGANPSDIEKKALWLKTQVRPSIDKLLAWGYGYENVLELLGLKAPS